MEKYELCRYIYDLPYTGKKMKIIPGFAKAKELEVQVIGEYETLSSGLRELSKHKSTAQLNGGTWHINLVCLSHLELIPGEDPEDRSAWECTGYEWFAKKEIRQ